MEPTPVVSTAIIAAISAGVTSGIKAVGKQAVLDTYKALKTAIKDKLGKESKSSKAIRDFENNPNEEGHELILKGNMALEKVDADPDFERIANELINALFKTESGRTALKKAKYQIDAQSAQVGVIGDRTHIEGGIHHHKTQIIKTDGYTRQDWEQFYLKRLVKQCDNLELTALEEICSRDGIEDSPMRVSDVFTTLYLKGMERFEGQSISEAILKPLDEKKNLTRKEKEEERFPIQAVEAAGALPRLVILGRPGGGKSTLVNHLAIQTARIRMGEAVEDEIDREDLNGWPQGEKLLPVRIVLRKFAAWIPDDNKKETEGQVWDYLADQLKDWGCAEYHPYLKQTLDESGGVIFFDGLDEVREKDEQKKRSQIVRAIQAFAGSLEKCRVIITCREYAYTKDDAWRLPKAQFPVVELDLFRSQQIEQFTRTWYGMIGKWQDWNAQKCRFEADNLFQAIETWPHLKELGRYPLLLTLMAQVHGRDGYLPRDRADLYDRAVKLLLIHWDNRIVRDEDGACKTEQGMIARLGFRMDKLKTALERVALAAHERQEKEQARDGCGDIAREDLRDELKDSLSTGLDKAEEVIDYIQNRAGLLQAEDNRTFRFPHRTFQEYLASTCIMKKGDFEDFLRDRVLRDKAWWQEVFLLAAGSSRSTPRNIYQLVDALLPDDPGETWTSQTMACARLSAQAMAETEFAGHVQAEQASQPGRYTKIYYRVQNWLLTAITADDHLSSKERADAGSALNWVDDPRFDPQQWYLPKEESFGFVTVPAGEFWMGSDKEKDKAAEEIEFPRHRVALCEYAMAKYPVTVAQYKVFAKETDYNLNDRWRESNRYDNHPVVEVTWHDAMVYCKWLTDVLNKLKPIGRIALPTEAQWEKAARDDDARIYPWGAKIDSDKANYSDTGIHTTSPVGCFPNGQSPYKILDMAGNVFEWCLDDKRKYNEDKVVDPQEEGSDRVVRGGSWEYPARLCRSAYRDGYAPGDRLDDLGFRLVLLPDQPG